MGHWLITAALVVLGVVAALGAALLKKLVATELEARLGKLPELAFWIALSLDPPIGFCGVVKSVEHVRPGWRA